MFGKKIPKKTVHPFRKAGLYTGPGGKGLLCREAIKAGETIEIAPLMIFSAEEMAELKKTRLAGFALDASAVPRGLCIREKVRHTQGAKFMVMGATAYCNRKQDANAVTEFIDGIVAGFYVLKAVKDIPPETEISVGA